jgi:catechol 2,3-dioxygenase-like lactoylglutathione lyase family enzyme
MAKVLGIGGVFFKVASPEANREWYQRVLGMEPSDWGGILFPHPDRGVVVWAPFRGDTKHFAPSAKDFMINLIVDDLDGIEARVTAAREKFLGRSDDDPQGRFAWILDPNGIKVELWEPKE